MKNNIRSKINLLYIKRVYEIIRFPTKNSTETAKCHAGKERTYLLEAEEGDVVKTLSIQLLLLLLRMLVVL